MGQYDAEVIEKVSDRHWEINRQTHLRLRIVGQISLTAVEDWHCKT